MPPCARFARRPLRREILAGLEEFDLRPTLLGQAEIDARGRQVDQFSRMIDGEIVIGLLPELIETLLIAEADPTSRGDVDRFEHALHAVFVLQSKSDHFKLQLADRA